MKLHLWGTDFRRSSSEFRAKLYLPEEKRLAMVQAALELGFQDLVYLPTCNRVEFYTTAQDYFSGTRPQFIKLLGLFGLPDEAFYQGYHLEGKSALRHLLRVGSSLESLVVGETQILGQLKDALKWTQEKGLPLNSSLERAFSLCFHAAKRVRTETEIGEKPVSVANLGLHHLQHMENEVPLRRAVVVGRSPICLLVVQWLLANRPNCPIVWVNRSLGTLGGIPESARTECVALSDFQANPSEFSHLFTSTSSPTPIFGEGFFKKLSSEPRLLFDFAQPPDIETCPEIARVGRLLHMEDLSREARENAQSRERAVGTAELMIDEALRHYCREQKEAPLLREFSHAEPRLLEDLAEDILLIEREFPEAIQPKVKRWAEKLVKKNWHRSRETLKEILQKVTEPDEQVPML
jgi:glutamyl-tRNA reductase